MATYNGEKFIRQLLQSILNQSYPVDEVVICEDCSLDDTVQVIDDFYQVCCWQNLDRYLS